MADLKISQLNGATTPLAGAEVLPIVQSGATRQVSVANLTAGRAVSVASLTASTGNIVIGTSGQGIDFSATPGTGTSELLNDYEEGTFIPGIAFNNAAVGVTYSTRNGIYTKVGRCVIFTVDIVLTSKGSSTGNLTVTNLPFTSGATYSFATSFGDWYDFNFATVSPLYAKINPSNTNVSLFRQASASFVQAITDAQVQNNTQFRMSGYYFV